MPYEETTLVEYEGRMVEEVVSRGAFDGIERRPNRVKVNRDHDVTRTCGRTIAFHPGRDEGLVAEVRIAKTPLGDETLELAADGILDASAGFLPLPGGMRWETRARRRLSKLWLGHIGMTPDPAFEGARVLAVRAGDPPVDGLQVADPEPRPDPGAAPRGRVCSPESLNYLPLKTTGWAGSCGGCDARADRLIR